jgi:hypothetical protein
MITGIYDIIPWFDMDCKCRMMYLDKTSRKMIDIRAFYIYNYE